MKLWSRICFLVLAISSVSRGQDAAAPTNKPNNEGPIDSTNSTNENNTQAPQPTLSSSTPQRIDTVNTTDLFSNGEHSNSSNTTEEVSSSTAVQSTTSTSGAGWPDDVTTGRPTAASSWGYVILVFIILVIIILCVILYYLRKVSRSYSFDLQRPSPISRLNEPTGTFEPVYLDDLDRPVPKDDVTTDDLSPPPVANGTSLPSEEKGSSEEIAPQEQPEANSGESSPVRNTSPTPGDDTADKAPSPATSTSLFFDALGEEQQNENNNNPSVCSSDPFVEINLDEPALCDQLLNSPEATSSVLPFSPFSFSSSS
ncbi:uncharacterized protein LOC113151499 isoform X2 [Anabas testudineus]|uniref:uncharacterized protein LOC113151499 isoform X2 n=1 Tax=Anabas testudineus TaxID=64144 RepID=UPI000E458595|nr:uncharacterized protein LOC113151499 isoform X2 [Anabas testudineus]